MSDIEFLKIIIQELLSCKMKTRRFKIVFTPECVLSGKKKPKQGWNWSTCHYWCTQVLHLATIYYNNKSKNIQKLCCFLYGATTWQNQQCGCVPSEDWDQPGHLPSLIRVVAVGMKTAWGLSYPLSAQQRLWSDWADAKTNKLTCAPD